MTKKRRFSPNASCIYASWSRAFDGRPLLRAAYAAELNDYLPE